MGEKQKGMAHLFVIIIGAVLVLGIIVVVLFFTGRAKPSPETPQKEATPEAARSNPFDTYKNPFGKYTNPFSQFVK